MSTHSNIDVKILGKEYQISCPCNQESALLDAAYHLNNQMSEIKNQGRIIGLERIAVMVALNLTHDLLQQKSQAASAEQLLNQKLQSLQNKLDLAINKEATGFSERNLQSTYCINDLESTVKNTETEL